MLKGCHTGFSVFFTTSVLWQMVNLERTRGLEPAFGIGLSPETGPDMLGLSTYWVLPWVSSGLRSWWSLRCPSLRALTGPRQPWERWLTCHPHCSCRTRGRGLISQRSPSCPVCLHTAAWWQYPVDEVGLLTLELPPHSDSPLKGVWGEKRASWV